MIIRFFLTTFLLFLFANNVYAEKLYEISKIEVAGNKSIEQVTIENYADIKTGDFASVDSMNIALKALYKTNFFSWINFDIEKKDNKIFLTINVTENPIVRKIYFEGNKLLSDDVLLPQISSKENQNLSVSKIKNDTLFISEVYNRNGLLHTEISPKLIDRENNQVDLLFEIEEDRAVLIESISFIGNNSFSTKTLKENLRTKIGSFLIYKGDPYDPDKLSADKEFLKRFYYSKGYADFSILSANAEYSKLDKAFFLTFKVNEGEIYTFSPYKIQNALSSITEEELKEHVYIVDTEIFDITSINKSISYIQNYLLEKGYAFAKVNFTQVKNEEDKTVEVTLNIEPSQKVTISSIDIEGNTHTADHVIRRVLRVSEGDLYNSTLLQRSRQLLYQTGYFKTVDFEIKQLSNTLLKLVISVEEQPTGSLEFGVNYSTHTKIGFVSTFAERNLKGLGQSLALSANVSGVYTNVNLRYTVPHVTNSNTSTSFSLFRVSNDLDDLAYDTLSTGATVSLNFLISEYLSQNISYTFKTDNVSGVSDSVSLYIKLQEGITDSSIIGNRFAYNKLDNYRDPKNGYLLSISQSVATVGGNARYIGTTASAEYYRSFKNDEITLSLGLYGGKIFSYADDILRINNRYYIGTNHVRGFDSAGIGPRLKSDNSALGAENYYYSKAQLAFPVGLPKEVGIKGLLFVDTANAFGVKLSDLNLDSTDGTRTSEEVFNDTINDDNFIRIAAGFGVSWISPAGNVSITYAFPIRKKEYDIERQFKFSFGKIF